MTSKTQIQQQSVRIYQSHSNFLKRAPMGVTKIEEWFEKHRKGPKLKYSKKNELKTQISTFLL